MSVRGDPLGALLEVLDPEQNSSFVDHYVGHALDLSEVFFIATANSLAHMPPALRDRLEIVQLEAYSPQEKGAIAVTHLWPKQLLRHGLGSSDVVTIEPLENRVVEHIAENYTREAGVRQLERCLASICRHIATKVALHREKGSANAATTSPYPSSASSSSPPPDKADIAKFGMEGSSSTTVVDRDQFTNLCFSVDLDLVQEVLGQPKVSRQSYKHLCSRLETPGVAAGLAWTSSGTGTVQLVECCSIARRGESFHNSTTGRLTLTGQLGEVLEESAHIALTLVRSMCSQYLEDPNPQREEYPNQKTKLYEDVMFSDVHVHLPAGSVPKDGPSAGVTLAVALTSLFFGYGCRADTAMTGEISLNGVVLAVGGVAEKVRAANKIGISRVIVPQANEQEARLALRGIKGNDNTGKGGKDETREAAAAASDGAVRTEIIPVKTVSEALEAAIVGGNPWAYHSTSMATAPPMAKL
jgi:ATP-dependent Lon protease